MQATKGVALRLGTLALGTLALGTLALAMTAASGGAKADPRLDEKVYDPYVEANVLELEVRSAGLLDAPPGEAESASVLELEYGLSRNLSLALVGVAGREPGAGTRWRDVGVEAVWEMGRIPKLGVDTGLYLEYGHGLNGEPDSLEGKLLLAKRAGRFEGLLNLIVERPLNAPAGENYATYGYAASATWRTVGSLRLGGEVLGNLASDHGFRGHQGAYAGPQLKWALRPFGGKDLDDDDDGDELDLTPAARRPKWEIQVDAGWLAAIGSARGEAGSQARVGIELERGF